MKNIKFAICMFFAAIVPAQAQAPQSFQEFRQGILDDFQKFRQTILDHYADFLNGTWHEYEPLEPLKKDPTPKPMTVPNVKITKPVTTPTTLPSPKLADLPENKSYVPPVEEEEEKPKTPFDAPKTFTPPEAGRETPPTLKVNPSIGTPILADIPDLPRLVPDLEVPENDSKIKTDPTLPGNAGLAHVDLPVMPQMPEEESREGKEPVNFYGMEVLVPEINFQMMQKMTGVGDFARQWKILDEQELADRLLPLLKPKMKELGLNDYLTYEFLSAYMDSKFPEAGAAPKMGVVHYLLTHLGFNARIALATNTGDPLLLLPVNQTLYGKVYMTIGGDRFYVMAAPGVQVMGAKIATCDLPKVASAGKKFDMVIKGLNFPMKEHPFNVSYNGITLNGVVNANLMPVVYRYPQMETSDFAVSVLDQKLRDDLVAQMRSQLAGKDKLKATNELLQFVQSGFEYATDDNFHGFEKPYFLEENLFYPKNDCEDRAIFYTYMLWNALGVESQLLFFPGHESASVALDGNIGGTSYTDQGKRWYISDPTYIGSTTGMCMPSFVNTAPKIDLTIPQ